MSHGRQDPILPFSGAEALHEAFASAGADVEFMPFDGGHTIPESVLRRLADKLEAQCVSEANRGITHRDIDRSPQRIVRVYRGHGTRSNETYSCHHAGLFGPTHHILWLGLRATLEYRDGSPDVGYRLLRD